MGPHITERHVGGLRHLVVEGERYSAFRELGRRMAEQIQSVQLRMPEREGLLAWRDTQKGRKRFDDLVAATARCHSVELAELEALADGSGLPFEDVLLANLRGDIGTGDGTGCTDLAWHRERRFVAHNEDAAPTLDGRMALLTLRLNGDIPVTTLWYPGFVPSNAFALNAQGVGWGINHVQVVDPPIAAGRHFVARGAQQAASAEEAVTYLRDHPTAGGFAYTIGDTGTGDVVVVESAGEQFASSRPTPEHPLVWHTNHLRLLPPSIDCGSANAVKSATQRLGSYTESSARGEAILDLGIPEGEPGSEWFINALTGKSMPRGVFRTAAGRDPLMTLCTVVLDLDRAELIIRGHDAAQTTLALSDMAERTGDDKA